MPGSFIMFWGAVFFGVCVSVVLKAINDNLIKILDSLISIDRK